MSDRASGYYWVRVRWTMIEPGDNWQPAEWDGRLFYTCGWEVPWDEDEMLDIGELIPPPPSDP